MTTTKSLIFYSLNIVAMAVAIMVYTSGAALSKNAIQNEHDIRAITEKNSEIMSELGYVFERLTQNTGTMMRYSHYLDNHDPTVKMVPFCPECTGGQDDLLSLNHGEQEAVPPTVAQLAKDSDDVYMSVRSIKSSLYNQSFKLKRTLELLKRLHND